MFEDSLKLHFLEFWEWPPVLKKRHLVLFKIYGPGAIFYVILAPGPLWLTEKLDIDRSIDKGRRKSIIE